MNPRFVPAYLLTLVNVLGFSLLLPVLPFVVEQYGGSKTMYGALLSSYSIFQALGAPYLGKLSDSIGRKPVLLISQAGTLLAWIIFGASYFLPNITVLGIALPLILIGFSRILDGVISLNGAVDSQCAYWKRDCSAAGLPEPTNSSIDGLIVPVRRGGKPARF